MRFAWAFVFVIGCSSSSDPTAPASEETGVDATSETASEVGSDARTDTATDMGTDAASPGFCTSETPTVSGGKAVTTHYELTSELSTEKTTALAKLLEAASGAYAAWFERPIPTPDGGKMKVKLYANRTSWSAGLTADGLDVPPEPTAGYYAPSTKTAYLYEQLNPYYTQVLLVHEAAHQFHGLSRLKVPSPPFWYVEGLAEYLARHDWDGSCIRLGVTSLLSWEDIPKKALSAAPIDVAGIVSGSVSATRPASWAMFRYLDTGPLHDKFKAYREAFDANTSPSFADVVDPAALSATLTTWLPTAQEPMQPIYTEWTHQTPTSVLVSTPTYFSIAMVKAEATHLEAKLEMPSGAWTAGVVASYVDSKNYLGVVHASDGKVKTFTVTSGSAIWKDVGTAKVATGTTTSMSIDVASGKATVTFDGTPFTFTTTGSPRVGLAANDTTARFVDVSFR